MDEGTNSVSVERLQQTIKAQNEALAHWRAQADSDAATIQRLRFRIGQLEEALTGVHGLPHEYLSKKGILAEVRRA